jgi:hypothetical protein
MPTIRRSLPPRTNNSRTDPVGSPFGKNRFTNVRPHTNFTLQKERGTLTLLRADGTTVAHSLTYGPQQEDVSFGGLGSAQTRGYFEAPSPGATNGGRHAAGRRLTSPVFFKSGVEPLADQPSAVITSALTLGLQLPADAPAGAEIRYTLTTAEPSETSPLYTTPLDIMTGTCVKARVFAPGWLPSKTGNRAFIWLSSAANTNATTLINVATNYNASGQPFSSTLPVIVQTPPPRKSSFLAINRHAFANIGTNPTSIRH